MKNKSFFKLIVLAGLFTLNNSNAQSSVSVTSLSNCQTQIVTLRTPPSSNVSYNVSTNQIVTLNSYYFGYASPAYIQNNVISFTDANGLVFNLYTNGSTLNYTFTGLEKIQLISSAATYSSYATFTILTPSTNCESFTPVNSVVIPSDATGNVQIILESSSDLVNWIPSQAGTYGSTYTNRFFRVRALAQ